MINETTKLIETWFRAQSNDGDFACYERSDAYSVIGPLGDDGQIIFSTKPAVIAPEIGGAANSANLGMIGRYGLPSDTDVAWIRDVAKKCSLLFLGDMDPADLMIFAWLREFLRPKSIVHLGVNDQYIAELAVFLPESFIMQCSPSELNAIPVLEKVVPDLDDTVGEKCAQILRRGRKIEINAIVSALGKDSPILRPVQRFRGNEGSATS